MLSQRLSEVTAPALTLTLTEVPRLRLHPAPREAACCRLTLAFGAASHLALALAEALTVTLIRASC